MYASHHPCWDAKNRYGLPDQMDMDFSEIAHLFNTAAPQKKSDPFVEAVIEAGLTITDIRDFSEYKGNFPGVTPADYPEEYKEALLRPEVVEKIKDYIANKNNNQEE